MRAVGTFVKLLDLAGFWFVCLGHIDGSEGCVATDVTSGFSVLAVMGPRSRCILEVPKHYVFIRCNSYTDFI